MKRLLTATVLATVATLVSAPSALAQAQQIELEIAGYLCGF